MLETSLMRVLDGKGRKGNFSGSFIRIFPPIYMTRPPGEPAPLVYVMSNGLIHLLQPSLYATKVKSSMQIYEGAGHYETWKPEASSQQYVRMCLQLMVRFSMPLSLS